MKNIPRPRYLKQIKPFYDQQLIKVITGQRRVGKSCLLRQVQNELKKLHPKVNFIYIDKEQHQFDGLQTYSNLYDYVKLNSIKSRNYLFIDEVQEINGFEKALRSLLAEGNYDIYCSGSNSNIFSGELATFLSGRQVEIQVYSLSFREFAEFNQLQKNRETLLLYLKYGGLPYLMHLQKEDEIVFDYLKNIYATILYRDVVSRNQIRDVSFLGNLVRYLADNTGSIVSANKISAYLKSQKDSKAVSVIINYLAYITQAYMVKCVKRQDVQGKRIFESGDKFYFSDLGLRNAVAGYKPDDIGKIMENAVYNHLQYLGQDIHVGKLGEKEVDFITVKNHNYHYFQVSYMLSDEKVIEREFGNLMSIRDNFPKYVISMDDFPITATYSGIKHYSLLDFLSLEEL